MTDAVARAAQLALAAAHRCDASTCADADSLLAFAEGRLPPAQLAKVAAQVAACAACAAAVRAALDASAWADDLAEDIARTGRPQPVRVPASSGPSSWKTWLPLAMAAGVVLMLGIGVRMREPTAESTRGDAASGVSPADGAVVAASPARLAWTCSETMAGARVQLLRADATPLWTGAATACGATLPPATREALVPGEYLWRVQDASGGAMIGPYGFRIAP